MSYSEASLKVIRRAKSFCLLFLKMRLTGGHDLAGGRGGLGALKGVLFR